MGSSGPSPDRSVRKWSVTLPIVPPSWNASYKIGRHTRMTASGPRTYSGLVKRPKRELWDAQMLPVVRSAKPSRWKPQGWVRIYWRVFLVRHVDMDNLQKAVNDVIEAATGVDDKWYLPIFQEDPHVGVPKREARIELVIEG